jgi:hypothetical protein
MKKVIALALLAGTGIAFGQDGVDYSVEVLNIHVPAPK